MKNKMYTSQDQFNLKRWFSLKEACQYASISKRKLIKHIKDGEIYGSKKGKWFVDRESIDAFFLNGGFEKLAVEKILASIR